MQSEPETSIPPPRAVATGSGIPVRPPWVVIVFAVVALALGILTTPERLLEAGRLRWYLTEAGEKMRRITEAEIFLFRIICAGVALLPLFWGPIARSAFTRRVERHEPKVRGWARSRKAFFNLSLVVALAGVAVAFAYVAVGNRLFTSEQLAFIDQEDGVIEYGTALLFLGGSVASAILAYRLRDQGGRAAILLLFALAFFLMCGEEISWGQRVLGVVTPEVMKKYNAQEETNLHNMLGYALDHLFLFGTFLYGVVFPILAWRSRFCFKLFDYVGLPIASLGLAAGFAIVPVFDNWGLKKFLTPHLGLELSEIRELLSALCLFLLIVEVWRKAPEDRGLKLHHSPPPA